MVNIELHRTKNGNRTHGFRVKNRQNFRANGENTNDFTAKEINGVGHRSKEQDHLAGACRVFSGQRAMSL